MPDRAKKGKLDSLMEATAVSQQSKNGAYKKMLTGLQPVHEHGDEAKKTDPDLMSSQRSNETIERAKHTIRKNSNADRGQEIVRKSKIGNSQIGDDLGLQPIQEDVSHEQSRVIPSNELGDNDAAQQDSSNQSQQESRPKPSGGALAGIFEQSAADQDRKKRRF